MADGDERQSMRAGGNEKRTGAGRRALKWLGVGLVCLAGLALALLVLLQIGPVRRTILQYALPRVTGALPGEVIIGEADWPGLEHLEFADVSWNDGGEALVRADTLSVSVHIWPLLSGDIRARHVIAHGLTVDIPGIRALSGGDTATVEPPDEPGAFPRPGVIPGLPSVAVDSLSIRAPYIVLGEGSGISGLALRGGFDFSYGGSGAVRIGHLSASGGEGRWKIEELMLASNLGEGTLSGRGSGSFAEGYPFVFAAESVGPDEFELTLARRAGYAPPHDPGVLATIGFERDRSQVTAISFDIALRTPSEDEIADTPGPASWLKRLPGTGGISARVSGRAALRPDFALAAHCEVREPEYLERGMVALRYSEDVITVDSLAVALPQGVIVSTAGEVRTGDEIRIALESIMVEAPGDSAYRWKPSGDNTGTVVYRTQTGDVEIRGVTITGDYGEMTLDGGLDGEGAGEFELAAAWPEPPAPLYALLGDEPGLIDSLRVAWAGDAPYSLGGRVTFLSGEAGGEIRAEASMTLPGPRAFTPLFPEGADVTDLGPVMGKVQITVATGDTLTGFDLDLDLSETDWMDTSTVRIAGRGDTIFVDDFLVSAPPLRLALDGAFDRESRSGSARVAVSDAGFLRRFSEGAPDIVLEIEATYAGAPDSLLHDEIHVALDGSLEGATYGIPGIRGTLDRDARGLRARVVLPGGLTTSRALLDSLEADFASIDASGIFPATITIVAMGEGYEFRQRADFDIGDTVVCVFETLSIVAHGNDLAATGPFQVAVERETGAFSVDGMNLAGSLGRVSASGFAGPDGVDLKCDVALDFPESPPPGLRIPKGAWPRRLEAGLDAPGANIVNVNMTVEGFVLDDESAAQLGFTLRGDKTGVTSTVTLDDGSNRLLDGTISLPAVVTAYPPGLAYHQGDVSVIMKLDGYPVLVREQSGSGRTSGRLVARVDGDINVSGSFESPAAYLGADVTFPDWPDLADFSVKVEGTARPESIKDPDHASLAGDLAARVARALALDRTEELAAQFIMRRGERTLLAADLSYPMSFAFNPFHLATGEGRLDAKLKADALPLEDIDIFLPPDIGLDGMCRIDLTGSGPAEDPSVSGTLGMTEIAVKYQQLLSLLLDGNLKIEGTARRPVFTGELAIRSGFFNLPEGSDDLHPIEGPSILLETAWRAALDTADVSVAGVDPLPPPEAVSEALFRPDYDILLDIAHGFWLRGEGLEIELEGKLQVIQKDNKPVPSGDLNARRGTFFFLGRLFDLDRGTISFYGGDELNPSLDLTLTSAIENYTVAIKLGGTLEEPELQLTSDPDLPEGDIMAMILFGKPLESLNEGQGDMLKDRTADVLITMGAARLQQSLAGQGSVDVVSIRSARGTGDQGTALVVGKYITPDLLVTYEQALKEKSTSYIVMEYMLTRYIKLETLYSNQSKTGLGVGVEKDY